MPGAWHHVGTVEEFEPGSVTVRQVAGREIGVMNTDTGLKAFQNTCPHQGGPICHGSLTGTMLPSAPGELHYGLRGQVIRCPWHGWEYQVDSGDAVFGISETRLRRFRLEVEGGDVRVYLP